MPIEQKVSKIFYQHANNSKKISHTVGPLKYPNGDLCVGVESVSDVLNTFFTSVFIIESDKLPVLSEVININRLSDITVCITNICSCINKMNTYESPGPDNIYP